MVRNAGDLPVEGLAVLVDGPAAPRRGRPTSASSRQVCAALLQAAERCLEFKPYAEITVREIAAAADVNPAMVNYYFQGKEGLFVALVEFLFADWSSRLREIEADARDVPSSPTQRFALAVRECFYQHRSVLWLIDHEIGRQDSAIHAAYKDRLVGGSTLAIQRFVQTMAERGVFRSDANVNYLTYAVSALAIYPIVFAPRLERSYGVNMEELSAEPWLHFLVQGLDRLLRP